ncbi:MAG: PTS sugar transporter subunit IIB [Chloroflexi bacterium]|nr:PTS sugar transporter subunit IIB [Chloroflexota bacterium]
MVRIDDRLIHGQVIAVWVRSRKFTKIQIVDDLLAADPFMVEVMRMSAPNGLEVIVETLEKSIETLTGNSAPQFTMILMKSPITALKLFESGITYNSLNIGGIGMRPGRINVFRNSFLSKDEYQMLKTLQLGGVKITFQTVPGE